MYNVTTPMLLNSLYEIAFWSNIQYEHTIVFTETLPVLPADVKAKVLVKRKEWKSLKEQAVAIRETIGNRYQPYPSSEWYDKVWTLTLEAERINKEFIDLLKEIGKTVGPDPTAQLLLHHVYEESNYFMRLLITIRKLMSV